MKRHTAKRKMDQLDTDNSAEVQVSSTKDSSTVGFCAAFGIENQTGTQQSGDSMNVADVTDTQETHTCIRNETEPPNLQCSSSSNTNTAAAQEADSNVTNVSQSPNPGRFKHRSISFTATQETHNQDINVAVPRDTVVDVTTKPVASMLRQRRLSGWMPRKGESTESSINWTLQKCGRCVNRISKYQLMTLFIVLLVLNVLLMLS